MRRLRFERYNRRLTQSAVSIAARIPQPHLSQMELGRLTPTQAQLERLSDFFNVPPDALLREVTAVESR